MPLSKVPEIIQWWVGPDLPSVHIWLKPEDKLDTLLALLKLYFRKWLIHPVKRRLAKYYLAGLRQFTGLKVIGITGSCGKTTTKEMLASILKLTGKTVYSFANIDPVFNIPTTILRCTPRTKYLVLEMGVEYPGEMDYYLWLAKPDVGIITNVYSTHTEFFGNTEGVFKEKSKLVLGLSKDSLAVLNADSSYLSALKGKVKANILWFGKGLTVPFNLPDIGLIQPENALAAATAALGLGMGRDVINKGLTLYSPPEHRMEIIKHPDGALIVDDSYNNNPEAARQALNIFNQFAGSRKKVLVFGDMLELGQLEAREHRKVGELISKAGFETVILIGKAVSHIQLAGAEYFPNWQGALPTVKQHLAKNTAVLIKGSRSIGLDNIVKAVV